MRNYFTQNFSSREISRFPASLFLALILAVLAGCGSGGMNSDPVSSTTSGTTVAPAALSTLSASQTTVSAGQSSIITANVTDGTGAALSGQTVTFSMVKSGSGKPTLSVASATTDGLGNAVTVYTPGVEFPTATVEDIIQANLSNSSSGPAITVTRSGNVSPATNYVTLSDSMGGSVGGATRSDVVTATVTNVSGNPVSGVTLTFSIAVWGSSGVVFPAPNPAPPVGPTLSDLTGVTDGNGKAITIYTSGATAGMNDVIRAVIVDGDAAIVITD